MFNLIKYLKNKNKKYRVYANGLPIAYFDDFIKACWYAAIEQNLSCNTNKIVEVLTCR